MKLEFSWRDYDNYNEWLQRVLETLTESVEEKDKEIERLNNIIKEVREFIEDDRLYMSNGDVLSIANTGCGKKILEILDKAGDEK